MKLRAIFTEWQAPHRDLSGHIETHHVAFEYQDGTLADPGRGFGLALEAESFHMGAMAALRAAGVLADPVPELSSEARERLAGLRRNWERARASMDEEARRYAPTAPPSSALSSSARWHARRYRLALWALGRLSDARTVTP